MSSSTTPVTVEIPNGADAATIGRRLKDAGLIRSPLVFQLMARVMGEAKNMKAGEYRLPPNIGVFQLIDRLVAGDAVSQWVVIPEGMGIRDIARLVEQRRLASASEFLRAAHRSPRLYKVDLPVERSSVEGYLMPDTYKLPTHVTPRKLIRVMLDNWYKKAYQPNRRLFAQADLPVDKIVVLASMIEREARVEKDRPLISSVVRNRLKKKMPLQIDATVIYALGKHKPVVTLADLKVDSPYNTYRTKGLPPGPICNPGLDAIKAALQPARTDYLYYVAQPDGSHIFTRTGEEHKAAIQKVKLLRASAK